MGAFVIARASSGIRRCAIVIEGVVQGVGFRPAVYRLAVRHGLAGSVRNTRQGVLVDLEGDERAVSRFIDELEALLPGREPGRVSLTWHEPRGRVAGFSIGASVCSGPAAPAPTPDLPTCAACLAEFTDPGDRRHGYALLTCSECGPRFSIVRALPYDRERTTLADFAMCADCRREYVTPSDRRFHAETVACPRCGPVLSLDTAGEARGAGPDPIAAAAQALRDGGVVAIKGIGGYHLACDATSAAAVSELRRRKGRDAKPLAVMATDLAAARALCRVSEMEARLLTSAARPIVLLVRRPDAAIAAEVAPRCGDIGLMLPYTAVHHRLLETMGGPLVMTSGNATDDTIAYRDDDARSRLRGVADLWLTHDRPIEVPCDDSVARVVRGVPCLIRRSRGFVPLAIRLPVQAPRPLLACGGELKNTFALMRGHDAFLSQHLGDLTNERTYRTFLDAIAHWTRLLDVAPAIVAHDLHPAYRSTVYARSLADVERVAVQHHHAHIASCLADNGVDRRVIGVAWDGTGYGVDGHVWGGEFLVADLARFERVGHFELVPLPGGDAAIREPWRMAGALLRAAYGNAMTTLDLDFVRRLDSAAWRTLTRAIDRGLNAPLTSSAGRLFDGVASLLGLRDRITFEAQAVMELEALAAPSADRTYATRLDEATDAIVVRTTDVVRGVVDDLLRATSAPMIAARFHATLVEIIERVCRRVRERTGTAAVALSGGVFQNGRLLASAVDALETAGFEVYSHRQVPSNDGGLALGQAAVAARRLREKDGG
jgi:hydrogenase maturation protein HypF